MAELVRAASLSGYLETMASLGADPRPLLRAQGFSEARLRDPAGLLPAQAALRLLERSAEATGCATFGLRMAEGRSLANLGVASLLIVHQPSLRQALAALAEFRNRVNSTLLLQLEEAGDEAILREGLALERPEPARQSLDLALAVAAGLCAGMLGPEWRPRGVCFTHQPPPRAELPLVERLFRCRPAFDCEFNGLVFARADLDRPIPGADGAFAAHARRLLEATVGAEEEGTAGEVEALVRLLLPTGRASIQTCAASLGLPVRTLQRRLDREGRSFSDLIHRARVQLAGEYLANPRMRIADVAGLLGYSSTGAFSRWHAQTFGRPPREARR